MMNSKTLPDLSKVEWGLMNQIWQLGDTPVSTVHTLFLQERGWSYNTVKTMLLRLVKKGYLERDDSRRAHVYRAIVPRGSVVRRSLTEVLDRILNNEMGPLVAYAAERRNLSDGEIERLKKILEVAREEE